MYLYFDILFISFSAKTDGFDSYDAMHTQTDIQWPHLMISFFTLECGVPSERDHSKLK